MNADLATGAAGLPPLPQVGPRVWDASAPAPSALSPSPLQALHSAVHGTTVPGGTLSDPPVPTPIPLPPPNPANQGFATGGTVPVAATASSSAAQTLIHELATLSATSMSNPLWARSFWGRVWDLQQQGLLSQAELDILQMHGYIGQHSVSTPSAKDLTTALSGLTSRHAIPGVGLGGTGTWTGAARSMYATALPADVRRAAPEIYRSLRAEGCSSTRQWLRENFVGYKGATGPWNELWSMASQVDIALGTANTDQEILNILASDDRVEISLRHIGAHFYEARTRDRAGAAMMRSFSTPGAARDIVPSWMVQEAAVFSKQDHQTTERVEAEIRRRNAATKEKPWEKEKDKKGKGYGKGKDV